MKLKDWLIPKNELFFELLDSQISKVVKASNIFHKAIVKNRFNQQTVSRIKKLEKECDAIVHEIFIHLNATFITPVDHEDIGHLTIACDDLIDLIFIISQRLKLYEINLQNKNLIRFNKIIKQMISETASLVIKSNKLDQKLLFSHAQTIHRLENKADRLLIKSLEEVFNNKDIKILIKEKEIYGMMEVLTDRIEDFCDLIQGIVTKNL